MMKKKDMTFWAIIGTVLILAAFILVIRNSVDSIKDPLDGIYDNGETEDSYVYNGFVFTKIGNLWNTQWAYENIEFNIHFHYGPREVENIPVYGALGQNVNTSKFYITFNPEDDNLSRVSLAASEISLSLARAFGVEIEGACTDNTTEGCTGRPKITCDNTDDAVIYITTQSPTQIEIVDNCITVQGPGDDVVRSADKMLYNLYGIIPHEAPSE